MYKRQSVFRQMSVEDNIASVLERTNKPKEYQKEKLESLIAEFRLQKVRKNKGNQLSGGERRRTEIALSLIHILVGSLTGVVASKRVTEASKGALTTIGNRRQSVMA